MADNNGDNVIKLRQIEVRWMLHSGPHRVLCPLFAVIPDRYVQLPADLCLIF